MGILNLLRISNTKALGLLEQAASSMNSRMCAGPTVAEIAAELSRSKAWVSMRLGLIAEMSPRVREQAPGRASFPFTPTCMWFAVHAHERRQSGANRAIRPGFERPPIERP